LMKAAVRAAILAHFSRLSFTLYGQRDGVCP